MIALEIRYAVRIHVASSWLAPSPPAMWRSETLAIVVSSTSMKVASDTTTAISHGLCAPAAERGNESEAAATPRPSLERDAGLDRHARPDVVLAQFLRMVEHDLDRHAL